MNGEGPRTRRDFDETYKRDAVQLTLQMDRSVKQIAEELGLLMVCFITGGSGMGPPLPAPAQ